MTNPPPDFDYLKDLYVSNPDEFKKVTDGMLNDAIDKLPGGTQQNAKAKQWRLEQELNKYKDPIARLNRFIVLFWEGVSTFQQTINQQEHKISNTLTELSPPQQKINNVVNINKK